MRPGLKKLREVSFVVMGTSPKGHTYNSVGEGLPLLNGPTEFGDRHPSCTLFTTNSVKECETGDLIFCVRGSTTGRMNWADRKYSLGRGVCAIRGASEHDTSYIKYCLDHRLDALLQFAGGTTFPNLTQDAIKDFEIPFPQSRIRIAETLSAYDDLIENNRRRMALLEESARLLYQEWFVRLRFPGHEHVRIKNGIPEGWTRESLREIAKVNRANMGRSFDGKIDYIDIASVTPGQINETTHYDFKEAPSRARRIVQHGDVIWSCVRPNRKSHAVIWRPSPYLIASTGFAVITPIRVPTSYLLQATTTTDFVGYLENHAKGAAYPAVVADDFERALILVPSTAILDVFNDFAEPLFEHCYFLKQQNLKLRTARDLLLPRLMSGEVIV
jgi:type I restriction enzyme S subunit